MKEDTKTMTKTLTFNGYLLKLRTFLNSHFKSKLFPMFQRNEFMRFRRLNDNQTVYF